MLKFIREWTLPIAMLTGIIGYPLFSYLSIFTPWLIFCMLLLTFCKVSPRDLRVEPLHGWLLLVQLGGGILVYSIIAYFNPMVAEGTLICIIAPTATSAAVITGMLGGSVTSLTTFTLLSNIAIAVTAPILFSVINAQNNASFLISFLYICKAVMPLLILPFFTSWLLQRFVPKVHAKLISWNKLSYYLWAVALAIVVGKTTDFFIHQQNSNYTNELYLVFFSLLVCCLQFFMGKSIGGHYKNRITGGQALGQKNTILAIWMAQIYLDPIASIGPASYVLWQNIINSWQLWKKRKKELRKS